MIFFNFFFLLPCIIFQLDDFPGLDDGGAARADTCQEGFPGAAEGQGGERCRDALERDPSPLRLGPGGQSSPRSPTASNRLLIKPLCL